MEDVAHNAASPGLAPGVVAEGSAPGFFSSQSNLSRHDSDADTGITGGWDIVETEGEEGLDVEEAGGATIQIPEDWRRPVAFSYLTDDEKSVCRARLEATCADWEQGLGKQAVQDLTHLALDCLVDYAHTRAYREQIEVGGPQKRSGPGWVRHQEEALGLASRSALSFCGDLRVLVRQEERATLKAIIEVTTEWWRSARQTDSPRTVQDLIELGANQLAVALMCRSARRSAVSSNRSWWVILAHRVVTRLIMRKMDTLGPAEAILGEPASGRSAPLSAQGRVIFYIQYILKTFESAEIEFEYRTPGEAIQYLRSVCLNCDRQLKRDWAAAKKKGEVTEEVHAPFLDALALVAQGVESDLGLSTATQEDHEEGQAARTGKQAYYLAHYWEILQNTLGRNSAVKYWLLTLLRQDGFEWDTIAKLFIENDCPLRYEDSLPQDVAWEEVNAIFKPMRKTGANLRQFWSQAGPSVHAEVSKRLHAA